MSEFVLLQNENLMVWLDPNCPVVRRYELACGGPGFDGGLRAVDDDAQNAGGIFSSEAYRAGERVEANLRISDAGGNQSARWYDFAGFLEDERLFDFRVEMSLSGHALVVRIADVREHAGCELQSLGFARWRLLCVTQEAENAVLGIDNDLLSVERTEPRVWEHVPYALVAANGVSASVFCNQIDPYGPLEVSVFDTVDGIRAAGIGPHGFRHRVKSRVMPDFEMRIGVVADYNDDGRADWADAANWLGDQIDSRISPEYAASHINKYFMCINNRVEFTIDQARERIEQLYHLTNGAPHIVYLVGWQYDGHDSEYPAMNVVNELIGGREKLLEFMSDAARFNFNISFHFNYDDAYVTSPDWDESLIAVREDGELVKGGVWAGGQSYIVSPYKLVKSGQAVRMTDRLLNLYPLRGTIHLDVLSAEPNRTSADPADPSDAIANLAQGKFEIIDIFRERGIDVTSEWITYPFVGRLTYYYHAGILRPNPYPLNIAALHGKLLYGGWRDSILTPDVGFIPEYLAFGAMADNDYTYSTPLETVLDIEYLLGEVSRLFNTRRMTGFARENGAVRTEYGPETWVEWNETANEYEAHVDGRLVSKDFACVVPTLGGWVVYSRDSKRVEFPLPEPLIGKQVRVRSLSADGRRQEQAFESDGGRIAVEAEGHVPYLVTG